MSYEQMLQVYGFRALWNPEIIALTIVLATIYLILVGPMRHRFTKSTPVSVGQKVLFLTGLFIFYFTLGSPLHLIGHQFLFSAHMFEQALVYATFDFFRYPCMVSSSYF
jgi:putative membrane protein